VNANRIAVVLALMLLTIAPNLHAACSNESLHGTYGYFSQGFIPITADISPALFVPQAQTGLITFDGKGLVTSGTLTINTTDPAGGAARGTFTGTYLVNPDCTGTAETMLPDNGGLFTTISWFSAPSSSWPSPATTAAALFTRRRRSGFRRNTSFVPCNPTWLRNVFSNKEELL